MMRLWIAVSLLAAAGCGSKQSLTVGSKNFTEQVILGEIVAQHLERRLGETVGRKLNLGGTMIAHEAVAAGQIDVYPEYSGTAWTAILKQTGGHDALRRQYLSRWNLEWSAPLGFDNSFAMVVRSADARQRQAGALSEARLHSWRLGAGYEFESRPDGLALLNRVYSIPWTGPVITMDLGLLYEALGRNQVDMVAGNVTDARLAEDRFTILKDDRSAFPSYEAALVIRRDLLDRNPRVRVALGELYGKFSDDTMRKLNYQADVSRRDPAEIARDFLAALK